jgi:hypothetical protein
MKIRHFLSAVMLAVPALVLAQTSANNALPECIDYAKLPLKSANSQAELFVLIDQTTPFSQELKQSVADQIAPMLVGGNSLSVYVFSAYTQGFYTKRLVRASLNPQLEQGVRDDISKTALAKFDQCLSFQVKSVQQLAGDALRAAFGQSSMTIAKSDIWASLKDISAQVKASPAKRKIVLLASDMLENSSVSNFYAQNAVRKIDPAKELALVSSNKLTADFGGADVYVIGAGLINESASTKSTYRDPKTIGALQEFWESYFQASNAQLKGFGAPALLGVIQ